MTIFSKEAEKNIAATGNVWGINTKYVFNFKIKTPFNLDIYFKMRRGDSRMGRFGGGWQYKLGVDFGGSTVILNCLVFSIRIQREAK